MPACHGMIAALLGVVVGAVLGLTGAGGSVLAVPLLMAGLGWSLPQAAPVALLAVAAAAAMGAWTAWRKSYLRYRAALLMAMLGWLTAPLGVHAAAALPAPLLMGLFAAVMLLVALRLWRQARVAPDEARVVRADVHGEGAASRGPLLRLDPQTGRIDWDWSAALVIGAIGALTGLVSGLLGVGGGFVIVPALRAASPLSMNSAVATSLMVIALVAGGAVLASVWQGHALPGAALPFAAGSIAGMMAGRALAERLAGPRLQRGFALLLLLVGLGMAARAAGV
ncbi:MAG TPA: sulfite exporter TauE/SafE family protein [Nevskiaceae bacterium]|nr:sulfite exporter TauE/SafE family protein [Nevskiaceae bacterium]